MSKIVLLAFFIIISVALFVLLKDTPKTSSINTNDASPKTETVNNEKNKAEINESLDLSNKALNALPSNVVSMTSLESLDISNNNITGALPGEIRHLKNLKVLKAANNNMTGIPAEMGQLSKLEILDLSDNQLTGLPNELGNLKNLKILNLSGNNYSEQDLEIIKQGLPEDVEIVL